MLFLRSLAMNIMFYVNTIICVLILTPIFLMPRKQAATCVYAIAAWWGKMNEFCLKWLCNITIEYRGLEHVIEGPCLFAPKHQSALETFALFKVVARPVYAVKHLLVYIPFFGWLLPKSGQIILHRGTRTKALKNLADGAKAAIARKAVVAIFPEGTRRGVDDPPAYKYGISYLYETLNVPVMPVAMNVGLFWPRRTFLRYPGTAIIEVLPPIPAGLPVKEFTQRLIDTIESNSNRLRDEARAKKQ
jgi:1-acyl-sn-glycerol-3-phosphate acyltransferase